MKGIAAGLACSAGAMLLCRLSPGWAEFLAGFARAYGRTAAGLSGRTGIPLAEASGLLLLAWLASGLVRALAGRASLRHWVERAGAVATALLLIYAAAWYPLYHAPSALPADVPETVSRQQLERLVQQLRAGAGAESGGAAPGGAAKRARFPEWMDLLGLNGIYVPMTGEAIVRGEDPFVARHEEMHARGIADEGQANILAYEACIREGGAAAESARHWALRYALDCLSGREESGPFSFLARGTGNYADLARYLAAQIAFDAAA